MFIETINYCYFMYFVMFRINIYIGLEDLKGGIYIQP